MEPIKSNSQKGFSLLELSIVLTIAAMLAIGLLTIGTAQHEKLKFDRTNNNLDMLENAILAFATAEGRLPCPARFNDSLNSVNYGVEEDCSSSLPGSSGMVSAGSGANEIWIGAVPTRSLNLDDRIMIDGWEKRISYAVIRQAATDNVGINSYAKDSGNPITVIDRNGNQAMNSNSAIGYILISHGKDGAGAYSKATNSSITSPVNSCNNSALDGENCDGDAIFRDTKITDSATISRYFFDVVRFKPIYFMKKLEQNF